VHTTAQAPTQLLDSLCPNQITSKISSPRCFQVLAAHSTEKVKSSDLNPSHYRNYSPNHTTIREHSIHLFGTHFLRWLGDILWFQRSPSCSFTMCLRGYSRRYCIAMASPSSTGVHRINFECCSMKNSRVYAFPAAIVEFLADENSNISWNLVKLFQVS